MKNPDEIKKGLECCTHGTCNSCPYFGDECDFDREVIDALEYIQQLEAALTEPKNDSMECIVEEELW